ncbi:DUF362 domain-containing protein [candidate division KSB1 bacterium]|nr:DUF362 domain-containing protein [candidate division KSB1 bacterium]
MTMLPAISTKSPVALYYDPTLLTYPHDPPFDPSVAYPERPSATTQLAENRVYDAVRWTLAQLGLDAAHCGTAEWNPLRELVGAGGRVVIKPNLVDLKQGWIALGGERVLDMVTHASVLRPLTDYAFKAVGPEGLIVIADAPLVHADFDGVVEQAGIRAMVTQLRERGYPVELRDLREEFFARWSGDYRKLEGDPLGNSVLDLEDRSALAPLDTDPPARYFTLADHSEQRGEPQRHHHRGKHEFCIPNTILGCDLFINVPKLKSHLKTGVTLSLKNLMGITHYRRWMPHHRSGFPPLGDEYPVDPGAVLRNRERILKQIALIPGGRQLIRAGAYLKHAGSRAIGRKDKTVIHGGWYGNDTLWRTLVDLNRVLFYGRPGGAFSTQRRAYLSLVDGIIAGEGNGPVKPTTRPAGVLAASTDPVAVDTVLTHVMGFDPARIRLLLGAESSRAPYWLGHADLDRIDVLCTVPDWLAIDLQFVEPLGWHHYLRRGSALTPAMARRLRDMGPPTL